MQPPTRYRQILHDLKHQGFELAAGPFLCEPIFERDIGIVLSDHILHSRRERDDGTTMAGPADCADHMFEKLEIEGADKGRIDLRPLISVIEGVAGMLRGQLHLNLAETPAHPVGLEDIDRGRDDIAPGQLGQNLQTSADGDPARSRDVEAKGQRQWGRLFAAAMDDMGPAGS